MNPYIESVTGPPSGILYLAALALLMAPPPTIVRGAGDYEYWAKTTLLFPVSEHWRFSLEERLTFGDEARRLDDYQGDYWLTYWGLADWLGLGVGYKQTFEKDGDDWLLEHRPMLNIIVRGKPAGLAAISRSRFEYRIPEDDPESWRYRNQVTVLSPVTFTALKIQPYVSDEIFLELNDVDFNQQRLFGGVYIPLHETIRLELFYLWKLDKQDDNSWHDTHVLGSYLHFQF